MQSAGGIRKGHQTNSGFSAQRTAHRFVGNALRLKLHGPPAAFEDRARCFNMGSRLDLDVEDEKAFIQRFLTAVKVPKARTRVFPRDGGELALGSAWQIAKEGLMTPA